MIRRRAPFFLLGAAMMLGCASGQSAVPQQPALSESQIDALAREAVLHTPEHTHFAKGTHFEWVLFLQAAADDGCGATAAIARELRKKYTVYQQESELPEGAVEDDDMVGKRYRGGFIFGVRCAVIGENKVEVEYSDYEGSLAAGNQTLRYRWVWKKWIVTWKSPRLVA
jgi:hypothetical protein